MTVALSATEVANKIVKQLPEAISEASGNSIVVKNDFLLKAAEYLKASPEFDFDYLTNVTAVDYYEYFELIYQLISTKNNHSLVLKTRCYGRDKPSAPSVVGLWRGADFQEREIHDLMGISFKGHPNLKHIVLWEGFEGHPLRKDFL